MQMHAFPSYSSSPSPIHLLPPELLFEVFSSCCTNDPFAPLTLRRVSLLWLAILDTSPRLWQTIPLKEANFNPVFTAHQAALWTTRASPLKYDIQLHTEDSDSILPLLAPLLPTIARWRSLQLVGKRAEDVALEDLTLESLTHLHLFLHDYEIDEFDDDDALARITFTSMYPDEAYPSSYAMNIWLTTIPAQPAIPQLHFSHLTISEGGIMGIHARPREILGFLAACPELESFHLSGWPQDGPIDHNLPTVHLPNLIMIHLKSTCSVRALLSSLVTPRLEYLYLAHLNVDFQLQNDYHEDGDSDDEAKDYSQSPWSDHATGMGLRRLITRSNPPLKVLEMDFCDMRTKDFRYVFDRLPMLEDFRIVASDMSDKVISFLRPIQPGSQNSHCRADLRIRLPRLRALKLHNCQRLTGSAIVDALSDRVKWTDEYSPDSTLLEITVAGCEAFSAWDRHLLTQVAGERLRSEL